MDSASLAEYNEGHLPSTHFNGGLNFTEKAATLCNGRSSCNITYQASSVSFVTVYYYCKGKVYV